MDNEEEILVQEKRRQEEPKNSGQLPDADEMEIFWWETAIDWPCSWEAANGHLPRFSR